jgi:hypothetical protein
LTRDWALPGPGGVAFVPVYLAGVALATLGVRVVSGAAPPIAVLVVSAVVGMVLTDVTLFPTQAFRDLGIYVKAGAHWLEGSPVYVTTLTTSVPVDRTNYPYLYPPFTLPFAALLAAIPTIPLRLLWTAGSIAAIVAAFRLIGIRPRWWPVLLVWPPVFQGLYVANVAVPAMLLFAAAPWFGAGLVLSAAFKAYNALMALWLARERRWRQIAVGIAIIAALALVTLPLVGLDQWRAWLDGLDAYRRSQPLLPASLYGTALPGFLPWSAAVGLAAVAVAAAVFARRTEGLARFGIATIVASPSLYGHGFIVGLPAFVTLRLRWAWLAIGLTTISPGGLNSWSAIVLVASSWVILVLRRPAVRLPADEVEGRGGEVAAYDLLGGAPRPWPEAPLEEQPWRPHRRPAVDVAEVAA